MNLMTILTIGAIGIGAAFLAKLVVKDAVTVFNAIATEKSREVGEELSK
jgi:hypothetical protein